jgi:putative endopeptidase
LFYSRIRTMTSTMPPVPPVPSKAIDLANFDTSVSPSENFYRYSNGAWLDANPIPPEYSRWGSFEEVHERTQAQLRAIFQECLDAQTTNAYGKEPSNDDDMHTRIVGIMYSTGMDEKACEDFGFTPMADVYAAIDAATSSADIAVLSGALMMEKGVSAGFWSFGDRPDSKNSKWNVAYIGQSGSLGIGDRDFYLEAEKEDIREKYVEHVARMLRLTGLTDDPEGKAQAMMDLETRIAESCMTRTERRDPHATYNMFADPEALAKGTNSTSVPWARFFDSIGLNGDFGGIIIDNPRFAARMGELLDAVDVSVWKVYARYHVTTSMAPYLNDAAVKENFSFHVRTMSGQEEMKPRWKRVGSQVGSHVEESLSIKFVAKHFSPEAKAVCKEMVDELTDVMRTRIDQVTWMSQKTRDRAHVKLDKFRAKLGYPERWDVDHCPDLAKMLSIKASYASNIRASCQIEARRTVLRINKPVDLDAWSMPAFSTILPENICPSVHYSHSYLNYVNSLTDVDCLSAVLNLSFIYFCTFRVA